MIAALLLTVIAWAGIACGVFIGEWRGLSPQLGAVGGSLLFAIALFLVAPEIAARIGWPAAVALTVAACCALALTDKLITHGRHSPGDVVGPLLAAAALHSFLDGWSVRALSAQPFANIAVPLGLALHKAPEGLAMGLVARKSMRSLATAVLASTAVESLTFIGACVEPTVDRSGAANLGPWWTASVLAVIAGSFFFVGFHTLLPAHREKRN